MLKSAIDHMMKQISPQELLGQLKDSVRILAAPSAAQIEWLNAERFPSSEMAEQLFDAVPAWFSRLSRSGLLDESAKEALTDIRRGFEDHFAPDSTYLWSDAALHESREWEEIRALAQTALSRMK